MIERKALDLILQNAEYEDKAFDPHKQEPALFTVEAQLTADTMIDPTAVPETPPPAES